MWAAWVQLGRQAGWVYSKGACRNSFGTVTTWWLISNWVTWSWWWYNSIMSNFLCKTNPNDQIEFVRMFCLSWYETWATHLCTCLQIIVVCKHTEWQKDGNLFFTRWKGVCVIWLTHQRNPSCKKREQPSPHPNPYSCRVKPLVPLQQQHVTMPVAVTLKL